MNKKQIGLIPIPALILIIAVLHYIVKPSIFYEPSWLIPITNTLFIAVICFLVSYIAMRNYKASGRIQILMLGCGVLIFGIGGAIAGFVRHLPGGANLNVTIYNTGALVGALFHFIAALILLTGISPEIGSKRKGAWLVFGYLGVSLFMALLTAASFKGLVPPFFIQGIGPTLLRQKILGTADILFIFSFIIFIGTYFRNREVFLYWYSLALALTAISLTAFFIQSSVGSPVGWAGRSSQYLAGIYFLFALVSGKHSAQIRHTSFDNVLSSSLSSAERKFRTLAENSPDIIDRFDRELRHIYINQEGLRLHGKSAHLIVGRTIDETGISEPYSSLWKERILKVFESGELLEVEDYFPTQDGMRFYESRCVPEFGPDGTVGNVLVVSRDLTSRKRAEEALAKAKEQTELERKQLEAVLEALPSAVVIVEATGRFSYMNQRAMELYGVDYVGFDLDAHSAKVHALRPNGTPYPLEEMPVSRSLKFGKEVRNEEMFIHGADGVRLPVLVSSAPLFGASGMVTAAIVAFEDITELKKAEDALKESETKYRSLFENMLDGFAYCEMLFDDENRPADFIYLDVNSTFTKLTGLKDVIGKKISDLIPGIRESHPEVFEIYGRVALTGKPEKFEIQLKPLEQWFSIALYSPKRNYFVAVFDNITARKQAEDSIKHLASFPQLNPNPVLELDSSGKIVFLNPAAERILQEVGMDKSDCDVFLPHDMENIMRSRAERKELSLSREITIKDRWFGESITFVPQRDLIRIYVFDITNRKRNEERIRHQHTVLDGINRIFREALASDTEEQLGQACLKVAEEVTQSQFGFIGEIGPDGCLREIAISDPGWEACAMPDKTGHTRLSGNFKIHGLYGRVILDGKGFFTNDPASHPDSIGTPEGHPSIKSFLGAPLVHDEKTIGMIAVGNHEGGYRPEDLMMLDSLSAAVVQAFMHRRAEEALHRNEMLLRTITDNSPDPIFIKDLQSRIIFANPATLRVVGKPADAVIGKTDSQIYEDPEVGRTMMENDRRIMKEKITELLEETVQTPNGYRVFLSTKTPLYDEDGNAAGIVGIARDITERKQAEEALKNALKEKETLLKELYHRTKNNMNVISGFMTLQKNQINDPQVKELFNEAQNRIYSMALVHEMLYKTKELSKLDLKDYFEQLARFILAGYKTKNINLSLDMDSVPVSLYLAVPCGLILNELLSNSVKHAFTGNSSGEIEIQVKAEEEGLKISYSDNGVGLPDGFQIENASSLGLKLVDGLVKKQLLGNLELSSGQGMKAVISIEKALLEQKDNS